MLNDQKWAKPVDTRNQNLGLRFEYKIDSNWTASIASNHHEFKRDDFTAFLTDAALKICIPAIAPMATSMWHDYQSVGEVKKATRQLSAIDRKIFRS